MGNERSLINYLAADNRLTWDVLDAKDVRAMFNGFDHLIVVAKSYFQT